MGLEAASELSVNGQTVAVKALLESRELILRGAVKKTLAIADLVEPHAAGEQLVFEHEGTTYTLTLPAGQAGKWLKKLTTAPPTLAEKLGVDTAHKALVWGKVDDAAVNTALLGAVTADYVEATQGIAIVHTPEELGDALGELTQTMSHAPIWVIYPKGAKSTLPESAVRAHLAALGYVDTKVSSVSEKLTATRFNPRKTILPKA